MMRQKEGGGHSEAASGHHVRIKKKKSKRPQICGKGPQRPPFFVPKRATMYLDGLKIKF